MLTQGKLLLAPFFEPTAACQRLVGVLLDHRIALDTEKCRRFCATTHTLFWELLLKG